MSYKREWIKVLRAADFHFWLSVRPFLSFDGGLESEYGEKNPALFYAFKRIITW